MIVDARVVPNDSVIDCDVCIVGAGAAGITIARELLGRSVQVVLLESGWLTPDADTQLLYAGEVTERRYFQLDAARSRFFGGTTNVWTGDAAARRAGLRTTRLGARQWLALWLE